MRCQSARVQSTDGTVDQVRAREYAPCTDEWCSPLGSFVTSVEVVLLLYTVIPLPLYMCVITGAVYTALYEVCTRTHPRPT